MIPPLGPELSKAYDTYLNCGEAQQISCRSGAQASRVGMSIESRAQNFKADAATLTLTLALALTLALTLTLALGPSPNPSPNPHPKPNPSPNQADAAATELQFEPTLTKEERALVHKLAKRLKLGSKSRGSDVEVCRTHRARTPDTRAGRVPGRPATHTCEPRLGQGERFITLHKLAKWPRADGGSWSRDACSNPNPDPDPDPDPDPESNPNPDQVP